MMASDAFAAHARDELGLAPHVIARPVQAALTSAATFAVGAAFPLLIAVMAPPRGLTWTVSIACLVGLATLGAVGARVGGSSITKGSARHLLGRGRHGRDCIHRGAHRTGYLSTSPTPAKNLGAGKGGCAKHK